MKGVRGALSSLLKARRGDTEKDQDRQQLEYSVVPALRGSSVFDVLVHYCRIADIAYGDEPEDVCIASG